METGNMTSTQNAVFIPEVIANEAIGLLGAYLQLGKSVSKDSDLTPVRVGQVLSIPRRGTVYAQQKTQGTAVTTQRPAADDVQVTVDQHWYVRMLEEDFTRSLQQGSVLPGYAEDGIIVLAEKIETVLAGYIDEFDNIDFTSGGSDTALKALGRVRARMVKLKVPRLAPKYGYVSPDFMALLGDETAFIDPKLIPNNQPLMDGTVGRARGFDIFEGQLVPTSGSPAWDQNFFYTRNALVLASRPLLVPGAGLGVEATTVMSDAGIALRYVRAWSDTEMGTVIQLDTVFGAGVNDERQGFVLESK